nr:MAG TPA: hypothetical protein [Caudoviricetes sp.]
MIDELLVRSMAFDAQDLFLAARRLKSCGLQGADEGVLDEVEGEFIDARNSLEGTIASVLMTFGVRADVELHRISVDGVE